MLILSIILGILLLISLIALRNLLIKVEKYEDVVQDQVNYLQNISNTITESKKHLQNLDERGVFQSDDEVGLFFESMKSIQEELDRYMLPQNYGKKEVEE
tara:strand:+ start:78 stop:377 length:300 start_codon:yes stop_codon:yes gene_type:complete